MSARDKHPSYPSRDIQQAARELGSGVVGTSDATKGAGAASPGSAGKPCAVPPAGALVTEVLPFSPADDAGFTPGCRILAVDGNPLRDIIDWRWYTADSSITLSYIDTDGDSGEVDLFRDGSEDWGFTFDGLVFDGVLQCRNACTFCFMHQLPEGLRPSLTLRDDDFRLSFLVGTFVTLTNLRPEDEQRIIQQHITPLHVSLQVSNPEVRRKLIGRNAAHGIEALDRLLAAGIQVHAQIVLVPQVNDGQVLVETLEWAWARPNILDIGIVPLGFTKYQTRFDHSFNDQEAARRVLGDIAPFQQRALAQRGTPWVFAADEFYSNAYQGEVATKIPPAGDYGDFELFEDGIGIIRTVVDDWHAAEAAGVDAACAQAISEAGVTVRLIAGEAQRNFLDKLIAEGPLKGLLEPFYVKNEYFGGNVDVTGLLVGGDVARAIAQREAAQMQQGPASKVRYVIQEVVFNDNGVMLDDMRLEDMEKAAGVPIDVVSCTPLDYLSQISKLVAAQ